MCYPEHLMYCLAKVDKRGNSTAMHKLLPVLPAVLALAYSPTALALGTGVLWYEGTSYGQTFNATQQAAMISAGASSFTDTTT